MIKVDKDLADIPQSLRVDEESIKMDPAKTTHKRRLEVIRAGSYPDSGNSSNHDSRYKYVDVRDRLENIYHQKCAFCETSDELMHVEHFRPKRGGYYWLAYSWDNLLLACPMCNSHKGNEFPLSKNGIKAEFRNTEEENNNINSLSSEYDKTEKPLLINPETVTQEVLDEIRFGKDGSIESENEICAKTIEQCNLDRDSLRQRRKVIWDDLKREIHIAAAMYGIDSKQFLDSIKIPIIAFKEKTNSSATEYVAFRRFLLTNGWIREEIHSLNDNDAIPK